MPGIFSFIKHPMLGLLGQSNQLIPGLEKAIALYYDHTAQRLCCHTINHNKIATPTEELFIASSEAAEKLRNRKISAQWMAADNLPFETREQGKKQLNIFDELNNVVLCVGFKNPHDKQTDLLFLYLNHNKGNFGISNSNQNLTTSEKSIIGTMALHSFTLYLKQQQEDSETLKLVNQKVHLLQEEKDKLNRKLIQVSENYLASIMDMCHAHLQKLSLEYGVTFKFAADALEKMQHFHGDREYLKARLTQSAQLALNLNFGQPQNQIILQAWDIDFSADAPKPDENISTAINERDQKTFHLLNKLENAARYVLNKNQRITSENVGQACPTPISAPAISDALKNHQRKLLKLMQEHPDKWPTIRNEFRPVKNILQQVNIS